MKFTERVRRETEQRYKGRDVLIIDEGSDTEVEVYLDAGVIDCGDVLGLTGHLQLARALAERVAKGEVFHLRNVTEAMRKEFRRAAERRGVKVYSGAARNAYGEIINLGITEFRSKEA